MNEIKLGDPDQKSAGGGVNIAVAAPARLLASGREKPGNYYPVGVITGQGSNWRLTGVQPYTNMETALMPG